ncbi:MAG: hypothetical protein R3Y05_06125 [bacterium]
MRLISVVMGYATSLSRNTETVELLNYGFTTYQKEVIIPNGEVLIEFNSLLYKPNYFYLTTKEDISVLKNKNDDLKEIRYELIYSDKHNEEAKIIVYYDDKELGVFDLIYNEEIEKRSIFGIMVELMK